MDRGVWRASRFLEGAALKNWAILNLDFRTRQDNIELVIFFLINLFSNLAALFVNIIACLITDVVLLTIFHISSR